uniref:Uncharacterized protein n=1 Tax=Gadus morhua TaxID=8049 RepID=A0A8C5AGK7_GADMO
MTPGNLDWVGNDFTFNAGAGLVISQQEGVDQRNSTVVEQLRDAFERDWSSRYTAEQLQRRPGHLFVSVWSGGCVEVPYKRILGT